MVAYSRLDDLVGRLAPTIAEFHYRGASTGTENIPEENFFIGIRHGKLHQGG